MHMPVVEYETCGVGMRWVRMATAVAVTYNCIHPQPKPEPPMRTGQILQQAVLSVGRVSLGFRSRMDWRLS